MKTPKSKQDEPLQKIVDCVQKAWDMDAASLTAFKNVVVSSALRTKDQMLEGLYKSAFVKKNLPPLKNVFPWEDTKGCVSWDWSKIEKTWEVKECTSVAKYAGQCRIDVYPGGCFKEGSNDWGCFSPGNARSPANCRGKGYTGACMHSDHGKVLTQKDVPDCASNCIAKCTGEEKVGMWGACFVKNKKGVPAKQQCFCVKTAANGGAPAKFLKRSCSTTQVGTKQKTYDALCKLPKSKFVEAVSAQKRAYDRPTRKKLATTTTAKPDRSLLNSPACKCQESGDINGKSTGGKVGCNYHLTKKFGKFCYISGGAECVGSKFSKKVGLHWRKCR